MPRSVETVGGESMMEEVVQLTKEERLAVKSMWSEIFYEDSDRFTDYYFAEKMPGNKGYGVKVDGELVSMMFLTPYPVWIKTGGAEDFTQVTLYYIVGVGTRKEYRHRGYMDCMLRRALRDICEEGHPFTFLMPANPAIYEPYQFRYIYDRPVYEVDRAAAVPLTGSEIPQLVQFANNILMSRFQIFIHRDNAYYERQRLESAAQNGDVYLWKNKGEIQGYYLYAREDEHEEIQEAMLSSEFPDQSVLTVSKERKPIIMARITNVKSMLLLVRMRENEQKKILLRVHDPLIEENNGTFLWTVSREKSETVYIKKENRNTQEDGCNIADNKISEDSQEEIPRIEVDITSLLDMLFGRAELPEALAGIRPLTEICINEIV